MATIMVGSARIDENGNATGGAAGDSLQKSTNDTAGEVSMEPMYKHSQGWYILRPKDITHAKRIAERMIAACNNPNIGYDQSNRLGVITYGVDTRVKTECDCSSLARQCVREATGKDPGNFSTANQAAALEATGLFETRQSYVSQTSTPVYDGDILVTKTKGHTVIVVSGNARPESAVKIVKATEPAMSMDKSLIGVHTVANCFWLNVRYGAGSNKKLMVSIPAGTKVRCYGYYTLVSGTRWLYVQFTYKGTTYTGFCSGKYLK